MVLEQIDHIESTATQSIKEVRQIAFDLRPYQLDNVGLTQALKELVRTVNDSGAIRLSSNIAYVDDVFSEAKGVSLYRIVQEALNNIVRHSRAGEACVTISRTDLEVALVIEDNGQGFNPESIKRDGVRGFGLTGLAERARMLNATLAIQSTPGQGTAVRLNVAIRKQDHD